MHPLGKCVRALASRTCAILVARGGQDAGVMEEYFYHPCMHPRPPRPVVAPLSIFSTAQGDRKRSQEGTNRRQAVQRTCGH
jgi:hypothetical protein